MGAASVQSCRHTLSTDMPPTASQPKATADKVVVGERLAMFNYYVVTDVDSGYIHCKDHNGQGVRIGRGIVADAMTSTSQFTREEKVTKTRLAQIMEGLGHAAFRVTFTKQVASTAVADGLDGKDLGSQAKRRKVVKSLMDGEKRVMHARLWRSSEGDDVEMELGRYKVVDLEASEPGKPAQRLVDTRTVTELVVEGVRYHTA